MRTRSVTVAAVAAALLASGCMLPGAAAQPGSPSGGAAVDITTGPAETVTVPLLTGDRVTVTTAPDGSRTAAVLRAEGREDVPYLRRGHGEHLYVIPADVAGLVGETLDERLFDVAALADAGFGGRPTLPVIVQQTGRPSDVSTLATRSDWKPAGITPERILESVRAVSDDVGAAAGAKLIDALRAQAGDATTRAAEEAPAIERVWLDAPVQALDADSAPQIGAPQAWEAGFTGEGVTVAVLDTGIDATHPDLDEVVVAQEDFSDTGSTVDRQGHGSHVASIVAGSGDASGGVNSGMAPDAGIMVGKVLDDDGYGDESSIIDGMEWAASQGADIINMSLGASVYTDGTDPMALAVDQLTAQHDALFVIAAGNDGMDESIGTPGSASSALTVGAVDDDDQVTGFSSRGPRTDGAIKPDIVAPGEEIVAARAAGTRLGSPVGEHYVALSGTSMAAPHVAGAAAVVLEARPDLTAPELKAALMGSADPTGASVFEEGAGRVFVPTAIEQPILADPASVSLGTFKYPHDGTATGTVTYRNTGDQDVVLDVELALTGPDGEAAEGASVSDDRVTVPANGTTEITVTVDRVPGAIGRYSGAVTATGPDGATVRTPVGWEKEPELFDLEVEFVGRDGQPFSDGITDLAVMNVDDAEQFLSFDLAEGATHTLRVPAGHYSVAASMLNTEFTQLTDAIEPEITVTAHTTVTLDAREAVPVSIATPRKGTVRDLGMDEQRIDANGISLSTGVAVGDVDAFLTPTEPVSIGEFDHVTSAHLDRPASSRTARPYSYDLVFQQSPVTTGTFTARREDLAAVRTTYAEPARGVVISAGRGAVPEGRSFAFTVLSPVDLGTRTEYVSARNVTWLHATSYDTPDWEEILGGYDSPLTAYEPGSTVDETIGGAPRTPQGAAAQLGDLLGIFPSGWSDSAGNTYLGWGEDDERLTVWQDGEVVVDDAPGWAELTMPPGGAEYRVTYRGVPASERWFTAKRATGEWTFHAEPVGEDDIVSRELPDVRYDVARIDLRGAAPRRTEVGVEVTGTEGDAEVRLWWSANDGGDWKESRIRNGVAVVKAPKGTSEVSLRAEVTDAAGNTLRETVERAYTVKQRR
ncbi:S8 family serine peptidase [Myceligenerans salitolerans]|uniref:S8 family serine peptidase n=1 Tax=Myceligenerans salitolerans TaxID=1230528 RepID=A0ABS3IB82_9MICO|nr:S8 family serine peptidase [Myceligenerans salitolerans]MBO0609688.1 S8 family serine peptidase [Myceligenerans salitolerans]